MPILINSTQMKIKLCSLLPGLTLLESSSHTFLRFLLIQTSKILQFFCKSLKSDCLPSRCILGSARSTDMVAIRGSGWYIKSTGFPFQGNYSRASKKDWEEKVEWSLWVQNTKTYLNPFKCSISYFRVHLFPKQCPNFHMRFLVMLWI